MKCGNANPKGNIELFYKGGCKKPLKLKDAYRCVGCGGYFHKECIIKHFEMEEEHDWGRQQERNKILGLIPPRKETKSNLSDADKHYAYGWNQCRGKIKKILREIRTNTISNEQ